MKLLNIELKRLFLSPGLNNLRLFSSVDLCVGIIDENNNIHSTVSNTEERRVYIFKVGSKQVM